MDTKRWAFREERLLTVHNFWSLLKVWKVTMKGIERNDAAFYSHFKKAHTRNCSLKKYFSKFCKQVGKLDYSRYILSYFYYPYVIKNMDKPLILIHTKGTRKELTCLVMGISFLVKYLTCSLYIFPYA